MNKKYIVPEINYLKVGNRPFLLDVHMEGGGSIGKQALTIDSAGKYRGDDAGMDFVSSSEGAATTGGFGNDNGPWESIW